MCCLRLLLLRLLQPSCCQLSGLRGCSCSLACCCFCCFCCSTTAAPSQAWLVTRSDMPPAMRSATAPVSAVRLPQGTQYVSMSAGLVSASGGLVQHLHSSRTQHSCSSSAGEPSSLGPACLAAGCAHYTHYRITAARAQQRALEPATAVSSAWPDKHPAHQHMQQWAEESVRGTHTRMTSATGSTKILPSPISPVCAAAEIMRTTSFTWVLGEEWGSSGAAFSYLGRTSWPSSMTAWCWQRACLTAADTDRRDECRCGAVWCSLTRLARSSCGHP